MIVSLNLHFLQALEKDETVFSSADSDTELNASIACNFATET